MWSGIGGIAIKKHMVDIDDVLSDEWDHQLAGSFGPEEHKELRAVIHNISIMFEVRDHNSVVLTTGDLRQAVEKYNSI